MLHLRDKMLPALPKFLSNLQFVPWTLNQNIHSLQDFFLLCGSLGEQKQLAWTSPEVLRPDPDIKKKGDRKKCDGHGHPTHVLAVDDAVHPDGQQPISWATYRRLSACMRHRQHQGIEREVTLL
ncbi:hypothetical protein O181_029337 [Austropuccinia psidii MF-1]|uniref:Uncharacterized protein n=1 Tax=Austropuccinia psidii MF-1 TaxID=1389203 RepID=A0A9Q3CTL8_9BASI|nr:hypothetical protein [Austropuccinia psidii MF-1]